MVAFRLRMSLRSIMPFRSGRRRSPTKSSPPRVRQTRCCSKSETRKSFAAWRSGEVIQLIDKDDSYEGVYDDLGTKASDILEGYFWIDKADAEKLAEPLQKIRAAANAAVEEYEKVVRVRRDTQSRTKEVQQSVEELIKGIERGRFENIDDFVATLASLREQRGHSLGLKELRYVDEALVVDWKKRRLSGPNVSAADVLIFSSHPEHLIPTLLVLRRRGRRSSRLPRLPRPRTSRRRSMPRVASLSC